MKKFRCAKIRKIIQEQIIETQEDLAIALEKEKIQVTQATISRDIKDLMLVKVPYKEGSYRYALPSNDALSIAKSKIAEVFRVAVIDIRSSKNLIVIKTMPGSAQAVAFALDNVDFPAVIGTIAGDDTILLVVDESIDPIKVKEKLYHFLRKE